MQNQLETILVHRCVYALLPHGGASANGSQENAQPLVYFVLFPNQRAPSSSTIALGLWGTGSLSSHTVQSSLSQRAFP